MSDTNDPVLAIPSVASGEPYDTSQVFGITAERIPGEAFHRVPNVAHIRLRRGEIDGVVEIERESLIELKHAYWDGSILTEAVWDSEWKANPDRTWLARVVSRRS